MSLLASCQRTVCLRVVWLPTRRGRVLCGRCTKQMGDAEQTLGNLPRTFFSTETAAEALGISVEAVHGLLVVMEAHSLTLRVCRGGWVITWRYRADEERDAPTLAAYLDDMMRHLGVGYYLSYAAAAEMRGASHHGVMRQRVNVEVVDDAALDALELRHADGPRDMAVSFHQINPQHGRPVAIMGTLVLPWQRDGTPKSERRIVQVATMETTLLDMMERPDRCGGMDHIATIAVKMLFWTLLHPRLLADASNHYEPRVSRRTGSMLQQIRGIQHWINLRPLWCQVRRRPLQPPVEIHSADPDWHRRADRWGVTHASKLDPDL